MLRSVAPTRGVSEGRDESLVGFVVVVNGIKLPQNAYVIRRVECQDESIGELRDGRVPYLNIDGVCGSE